MLVMQNSPQRQVSSLYGQSIRPQALEPPVLIVQPCLSACLIAASISGFECLFRATDAFASMIVKRPMIGCQLTTGVLRPS